MKFSITASMTLAILAEVSLARNCQHGNYYCGRNLNYMGNYQMEMEEACQRQGSQDCWGMRVNHVLFRCEPLLSGKGRVALAEDCNEKTKGCQDGGALANDWC